MKDEKRKRSWLILALDTTDTSEPKPCSVVQSSSHSHVHIVFIQVSVFSLVRRSFENRNTENKTYFKQGIAAVTSREFLLRIWGATSREYCSRQRYVSA